MPEPIKCHDCGQSMSERLFISGLCIGCERSKREGIPASESDDG